MNLHLVHDPLSKEFHLDHLVAAMNLVRALVTRSLPDHSPLTFPKPPSGQNLSSFHPLHPPMHCNVCIRKS